MALTLEQKQKARDYLGVPSIRDWWLQGNSGPDLDLRMDELPAEAEARVVALLGKLDTSRTDIEGALGRLKAAEVEGIVLNPRELRDRWREDLKLCQQLAVVVAFEVKWHPALPGCREVEC